MKYFLSLSIFLFSIYISTASLLFSISPVSAEEIINPNQENKTEVKQETKKEVQNQGIGDNLIDRIDFGNAYITGQTVKSGAIYLLNRKKSEIKSMLEYRKNYRKEILEEFNIKDKKSNLNGDGC
ncbi:MAG: hypothetical protein V1872_02400 [bacterium]